MPSFAQVIEDGDGERVCSYEQRYDPFCIEARAAQSASLYGLDPVGEGETLRIFFIDAWDRDRRAITASRRAGSQPRLDVHFNDPDRTTLSENVSGETWESFFVGSALVTRTLNPRPPSNDGTIPICTDGTTTIVELYRPGEKVIRVLGESCADTNDRPGVLPYYFADRVHRVAAETLTVCSDLSREFFRGAWQLLDTCAMLDGDVPAASDAIAVLEKYEMQVGDFAQTDRALATGVVLEMHDGSRIEGRAEVGAYWKANFELLYIHGITGLNAHTARIDASIDLAGTGTDDAQYLVIEKATLTLDRVLGRDMLVTEIVLTLPVAFPEPDQE